MGKSTGYSVCHLDFITNLTTSLLGRNESIIAIQGWRGGLGNTNTLRILITP